MTQNSMNSSRSIAQVVSSTLLTFTTCTTVMPADDTIPQNTEGDQILTATITPKSSTSTLEIRFNGVFMAQATANSIGIAIFQDTTSNAIAGTDFNPVNQRSTNGHILYYMTSGTTSSTTFKVRVGPNTSATISVNGNVAGTQMFNGVCETILTITEYL